MFNEIIEEEVREMNIIGCEELYSSFSMRERCTEMTGKGQCVYQSGHLKSRHAGEAPKPEAPTTGYLILSSNLRPVIFSQMGDKYWDVPLRAWLPVTGSFLSRPISEFLALSRPEKNL